jgi:hypothetical protein
MTDKEIRVSFYDIVSLFASIVLQRLGKVVNPLSGKVEKNLDEARVFIDMLSILEEKTKGNLTKDEENFLTSTITNLRLNYIEEVKEKGEALKEKKEK